MASPFPYIDNDEHDPRDRDGAFRPKRNLGTLLDRRGRGARAALADQLGKSRSRISNWLSGAQYMSNADIVRTAQWLGVSPFYLLDRTPSEGVAAGPLDGDVRTALQAVICGTSIGAELWEDYDQQGRLMRLGPEFAVTIPEAPDGPASVRASTRMLDERDLLGWLRSPAALRSPDSWEDEDVVAAFLRDLDALCPGDYRSVRRLLSDASAIASRNVSESVAAEALAAMWPHFVK